MKITEEQWSTALTAFLNINNGLPHSKDALWNAIESIPEPLPTLRPIAEMSEKPPEGCVRLGGHLRDDGTWTIGDIPDTRDTHAFDILLPTPDPEAEMRKEFEAAMRPLTSWGFGRDHGEYSSHETGYAWIAWKLAKKGGQP